MSNLLFGVIAATSLAATGMGATAETRSAQSLPAEHLVVPPAHSASSGSYRTVNHMADAGPDGGSGQSGQAACDKTGGHWNAVKMKCEKHRPVLYLIGAGTTAGFIYALTSNDGSGSSGSQPAISN